MCINPSKFDGLFRRSGSGSCTATTTTTSTNNGQKNENHDDGIYHTNKSSSTSALRRMTPFILFGYLFNTLAYFAIVYAPFSERITFAPYPQFCPEDSSNINNTHTSCTRRDLFAFQAVSFLNLTYLGLLGTYTFFFSECRAVSWNEKSGASTSSELLPPTPHGRYFGKLSAADSINAVIVIFQGWDFMASLFFEEHCTLVMMMHHLLAFVCGFFSLVYEVAPYYAGTGEMMFFKAVNSLRFSHSFFASNTTNTVYFGGVSEFSSIFLCLAQIFEFYPPSSLVSPDSPLSSILPTIVTCSQAMFVITFFAFRIVGWAIMSHKFILDGSFIIKNRLCMKHSPGSGWFLWYLLTTSGLLGALQVFWLKEIVNKVLEM
ncbi:hypothetical protein ACHAWU_003318 [Discostella pseudostelligera]|uniref:TLC domain-containing protein n=1 Tax=Discostella pseudostelligera TaxID=259834 RepID=A0ABD3MY89_9STRA